MDLSTREGRREQGQRLQLAVDRAGISIEELANRIGCSRALIYQYLGGATLAQPDRMQQIAVHCGVPLSYFYSDQEPLADETASHEIGSTPLPDMVARLTESVRGLSELAEAQASPPNNRSLVATCERIVSLAEQLGDRESIAEAHERLGNALLASGENMRASEALARSAILFAQTNDARGELSSRQSLGKALWGLGKTEEARAEFIRVTQSNLPGLRWRGLLSLGSLHEQFGEYAEAMRNFDQAGTVLEEMENGGSVLSSEVSEGLLYVNTNRRNVYMACGDFEGAKSLAERALTDAESQGNADQHLEARFDQAWIDFHNGRWSQAYTGWVNTLQLARFTGDQGKETLSRAFLGIFMAGAGDCNSSITYGKDALSLALSRGDRQGELYAQLCLADAYTTSPGRIPEARYHANQALAVTAVIRYTRAEIECRLRMSHIASQENDVVFLREASELAASQSQRQGNRHLEAAARCRLAESLMILGELSAAQIEADKALHLAEITGAIEPLWRSKAISGIIATQNPDKTSYSERMLKESISVLNGLRTELKNAGLTDTLLEDVERMEVYAHLARLMERSGRIEEKALFLEQTGWPPLVDKLRQESEAGQS